MIVLCESDVGLPEHLFAPFIEQPIGQKPHHIVAHTPTLKPVRTRAQSHANTQPYNKAHICAYGKRLSHTRTHGIRHINRSMLG
jgi:hypothetical protein